MDRLLMDDSHRDDCLILVENKGLILFEELLKTSFQDSSNKMKLIISKNIPFYFGIFSLFRTFSQSPQI